MTRTFTITLLCAALALPLLAQSQGTEPSPAKKELVARLLKLQQPAVEGLARQIVETPASQLLQRAAMVVQARVEPDKRQSVFKELQDEARQYADAIYPLVREKGVRLAPSTIGVILEEKMTEAELSEVVRIVESSTWKKFQSLGGEMQRALGEKLLAEVKDQVEPRVRELDQRLARRLTQAAAAASAPATGK